ncbi:MAG: exosortase K [Flavobacteriales bacterium]|nr:exosortase K [Flavobacteriales bacterium]
MSTDKRKTIVLGMLLLAAAFALKWWYRTATVEQLGFVLTPVTTLISLLTGVTSTFVPGQGHLFPELGIVIDRSCSGINFLIITTASFTFLWLRRTDGGCSRTMLATVVVIAAWVLTVLANTGRILFMVHLEEFGFHFGPTVHEALGAFFFLASLLLASLAFDRLLPRHHHAHTT